MGRVKEQLLNEEFSRSLTTDEYIFGRKREDYEEDYEPSN